MKLQRLLTVGFLLALTFEAALASPNSVIAEAQGDGSVVIEGARYADPVPLKSALKKLEQRHVPIQIHVHAEPSIRFEAVGKAIILLQKAGYTKIGFIAESRTG